MCVVFVHMFVVDVYICVHAYMKQKSVSSTGTQEPSTLILDKLSHWVLWISNQARLTGKQTLKSFCLFLSRAGITNHHIQIFLRVLGLNSDPRAGKKATLSTKLY